MEIEGILKIKNSKETFASGFEKRTFVIQTIDKYPQMIQFELFKDKCGLIDQFNIDEKIKVGLNIRGSEYKGKFYVSLNAWKIERLTIADHDTGELNAGDQLGNTGSDISIEDVPW